MPTFRRQVDAGLCNSWGFKFPEKSVNLLTGDQAISLCDFCASCRLIGPEVTYYTEMIFALATGYSN